MTLNEVMETECDVSFLQIENEDTSPRSPKTWTVMKKSEEGQD